MSNVLAQTLFQLAFWAPPLAVLAGILLVFLPGRPRPKQTAPPAIQSVDQVSKSAA
jgi:hypothetical protein